MPLRPSALALAIAIALAIPVQATAQRTWTVAPPGQVADFNNLPPAVAAAAPGDTIVVRGRLGYSYAATTITRGITIVGVPDPLPVVDQLIVRGVPAGERASLSGLVVLGFAIPAIRIERCDGAVVLDSVSQLTLVPNGSEVDRCRHVVLRGCTLSSRDRPLRITDSGVLAVRSSLDMFSTTNTGAGIRLTRSELELVDTTVLARTASFIPLIVIRADRSEVRISGATVLSSSPAAFPAFDGICTGGASTVIAPPGHGLTALRCVNLVSRWVPSVGLDQPIRGTPLQWQVHGTPGSVHLLFAGLPATTPVPLGFGDLWLAPMDPVEFIGWASPDASGTASGAVGRVPAGFPPGLTVAFQSAVFTTGQAPTLSAPAIAVSR